MISLQRVLSEDFHTSSLRTEISDFFFSGFPGNFHGNLKPHIHHSQIFTLLKKKKKILLFFLNVAKCEQKQKYERIFLVTDSNLDRFPGKKIF